MRDQVDPEIIADDDVRMPVDVMEDPSLSSTFCSIKSVRDCPVIGALPAWGDPDRAPGGQGDEGGSRDNAGELRTPG
jgi:hypothetical protein